MSDNLEQRVLDARNAAKEARKTYGVDSAKYKQAQASYEALQAQWNEQRRQNQSTDRQNP